MCMIICKEKGVDLPTADIIEACSYVNKDGVGISWADGETVYIKKNFRDNIDFYTWMIDNLTRNDVCIIHFRLATHGLVDIGNRHPFPVSKNTDRLRQPELTCDVSVAHNGVFSQFRETTKLSDTQLFIKKILSAPPVVNNLDNRVIKKLIADYIGSYNKLAFLTKDQRIIKMGDFQYYKGLYFSNSGFRAFRYIDYMDGGEWGDDGYTGYEGKTLEDQYKWNRHFEYCRYCFKQYSKKKMYLVPNKDKKNL